MASLLPTSRLSSVDFPALGRPISDTNPNFIWTYPPRRTPRTRRSNQTGLLLRVLRVLCGGELTLMPRDPDLVDSPALGVDHFDAEAVDVEPFSNRRNAADMRQQKPADGLESFALDRDPQTVHYFVDVNLPAE